MILINRRIKKFNTFCLQQTRLPHSFVVELFKSSPELGLELAPYAADFMTQGFNTFVCANKTGWNNSVPSTIFNAKIQISPEELTKFLEDQHLKQIEAAKDVVLDLKKKFLLKSHSKIGYETNSNRIDTNFKTEQKNHIYLYNKNFKNVVDTFYKTNSCANIIDPSPQVVAACNLQEQMAACMKNAKTK